MLLTTGRQAQESDVTPFDVGIQPLLDMGTHTYVIAIGSDPSVRELRPLVANPDDLFQILFNILQSQVSRVVKYIRTGILSLSPFTEANFVHPFILLLSPPPPLPSYFFLVT